MMQAASDIYLGWTKGVQANRYLSHRYAEKNEADYQAFVDAVRSGRIPAVEGL